MYSNLRAAAPLPYLPDLDYTFCTTNKMHYRKHDYLIILNTKLQQQGVKCIDHLNLVTIDLLYFLPKWYCHGTGHLKFWSKMQQIVLWSRLVEFQFLLYDNKRWITEQTEAHTLFIRKSRGVLVSVISSNIPKTLCNWNEFPKYNDTKYHSRLIGCNRQSNTVWGLTIKF